MHRIAETALGSLLRVETYSQIHQVIVGLADNLGFRSFGYQYWPGGPAYGEEGFSGVVQSNYPDAWLQRYVELDYYDDDPLRLYSLNWEGVTEWGLVPRWTARQEQVMQDAARYGLEQGVIAGIQEPNGGRKLISFAGPAGEGNTRLALEVMQIVAPTMTMCFRKTHGLEEKLKFLTERQRDVFLLLRKGRRRDEIAHNLSISLRQVDRHISQLKNRADAT